MAITNFVGRLAALVAFSDNTVRQVLASKDDNDNISVNDATLHDDTILQVEQDTGVITDFGIAASVTVTPVAVSVETDLTATDIVFEVSGLVTNSDNTTDSFIFQYRDVGGVSQWFVPLVENSAVSGTNVELVVTTALATWDALNTDSIQKAKLVELFAAAGITLS